MCEPTMQQKSLLSLAKLYIQASEYDIARKMFETMQFNKEFYIQSTISLVCLNILEQNYCDALKLLRTINKQDLTKKLMQHYYILENYILYFLGKLKKDDIRLNTYHSYMIGRLFDYSDELLLKHIQRHTNQEIRQTKGCFFEDIDLKRLLMDAKNKIETMNPNHFRLSDMYLFRMNRPIGFKEDEITNDLCVVTVTGTKEILTMYPVSLSNEFGQEQMLDSKQLTLTRKQGD